MEVIKYLNKKAVIIGHKGALESLTEELGIKVTYNEEYDLYVLNYSQIDSPKTHPIVVECRSLVLETLQVGDLNIPEFNVVSRSFDRFLNLGENGNEDKIDITKMKAYEKLDGSLIGLFYHNGEWLYRTKSMIMPSSEMDMNAFGNKWKDKIEEALNLDIFKYTGYAMRKQCTFILELTSPFNRIVTRYSDTKVTLLAVRYKNGEYTKGYMQLMPSCLGWDIPKVFDFNSIADCKEAVEALPNLEEGFVLYDEHGVPRCKIKSSLYLAVHRIRGESTPTPKRIMDLVFTNETDEYLTYFKEDTYLFEPYISAHVAATWAFNETWEKVKGITNQKEFALTIKGNPVMHLMFRKKQNNSLTFRDCFSNLTTQAKYNLVESYLK